jgi:hypothetical protein
MQIKKRVRSDVLERKPMTLLVSAAVAVGATYLAIWSDEEEAMRGQEVNAIAVSTLAVDEAKSRPTLQLVVDRGPQSGGEQSTNPLNAERAYVYLNQICAIGPRPSGSNGMREQLRLLRKHFADLGGQVSFQQFTAPNPLGGQRVPMANLIVQWHAEKKERILLCAHYDTRPLPDRDPDPNQALRGIFIGANDGASGVAVLMELAHLVKSLDIPYGIDFVFFDGEEFVYDDSGKYFLGSEHFANEYVRQPPPHKYRWGVLLDMVGDKDLQVYQERHSAKWPDTQPLVAQIWGTAQRLGVKEFVARPKYEVLDDHMALRHIAKIPTCDVIDFDYPAWHTTADVAAQCSGESLAKVGWVVYEWLKGQPYGAVGRTGQ